MVPELDVSDLSASLQFWCEYLGFQIAYDRPAAGFAYLERGPLQIMLCTYNGEWVTGRLERPFGRGVNFQMKVDDLDEIAKNLTKVGWPLFREIEEKQYRVGDTWVSAREFLVQDPDGFLVRLTQSK